MLVDPKRNCHRYIHPTGPIFVNKNVPGVFMACASATNNISTGFTGEEINDCVTSDGIDPTSKTERGHSVGPNRRDICRVSSGCPSIALLKRRCRCCFLAMWMKSWIMSLHQLNMHIQISYHPVVTSYHQKFDSLGSKLVTPSSWRVATGINQVPQLPWRLRAQPRASRLAVAHVSNPMKPWPRIDALNKLRSGLAWISHLFGIWLGPNCWLSQKLSKILDLILGYLGSIPNIYPQKLVIVIIPPSVVNASKHVKPHEWARQVGPKESLSQFVSIPSGYVT